MTVPYVLLVTENVSNASITELTSQGIEVRHTELLTVPQARRAAKYHLDIILTPLFSCGSFCATFRHSDKFNAGVLVLKPNL
ncbi:hypothetical protein OSTOST_13895, partial [Ostertagia ostertagi]